MHTTDSVTSRHYAIDWVRCLALMLLILYHIGMYYVLDWGWHVKSVEQSKLLQEIMILTNPWRMSLLFFVSGMTFAFIQDRYSGAKLIGIRTNRIFIPLLFGMAVIVPPQLYFELKATGTELANYWDFYKQYLDINTDLAPHKQSSIGLYTWNHLWYLAYLWVYTLVFVAIHPVLKRLMTKASQSELQVWHYVVTGFVLLLAARLWLRADFPTTHGLTDDWYNHARYFITLCLGYAVACLPNVWQALIQRRRALLIIGLLTWAFFVADRNGAFPNMGDWYKNYFAVQCAYGCVIIANLLAWIGAFVGYACQYLNHPSKLLEYTNQAILPWYILHQSVIIILAMFLLPLDIPAGLESIVLIIGTCTVCFVGYEVIKRVALLRWLFGLKLGSQRTELKITSKKLVKQ